MTSEKAEELSRMIRKKIDRSGRSSKEILKLLCMVCKKEDGSALAPKEAEHLSDMLCEMINGNGLTTAQAETLSGMNCKQLQEKLHKMLRKKKYLVVIDDIWKVEDWERISLAFPDDQMGSRIIFTTRKVEVVNHVDSKHDFLLPLPKLNETESWQLFERKVFTGETCPQELLEKGKAIVKKCGGVSLAILGMAGVVMGKERTKGAWKKVLDSANWQLSQDSSPWRGVLSLSYYDLPEHLKSCFLYLGLFPEDYDIRAEYLICRWVAEGFIQDRGDQTMEDVAEDFLEELIQRNMVQVTERAYRGGPVTKCRIDNLQRDLAISKAKQDRFMEIHANRPYFMFTGSKLRRLAIHSNTSSEHAEQIADTTPNLRTLVVINCEFEAGAYLKSSTSPISAKILRVLDLEGVKTVKVLPVEIGKLRLLHYLGLGGTGIKSLPGSMRGLVKLQTLTLNLDPSMKITSLLEIILKLKSLRHLHLSMISSLKATPPCVRLGDTKHVSPASFGRNLLSLKVKANMWMYMSNVLMRAGCLRKLHLQGRLDMLNCLPSSLVELRLLETFLQEDPSAVLGDGKLLPKLKQLYLDADSYVGQVLHFSASRFPQLEYLCLARLPNLIEWTMEDHALPSLKHLEILDCENLEQLPDKLRSVTGLQEVRIETAHPAFLESLQERGASWDIIQNVPYTHVPKLRSALNDIMAIIGGSSLGSLVDNLFALQPSSKLPPLFECQRRSS